MTAFEDKLALVEFMCRQFGADSAADLRGRIDDLDPGFGADGHSDFYRRLVTSDLAFDPVRLRAYDANIRNYEERIRRNRAPNVQFRPFQYLALLLTERYLDWYFTDERELHVAFEAFVEEWNDAAAVYEDTLFRPQASDMTKLAYWMATGSGKTFLLHANYWQFDRHSDWAPDNAILLTPNEGLAQQHLAELETSGIDAEMLGGASRKGSPGGGAGITVVPIHKLRETEGETTIAAESLAGRNVVFVDEGHKGTTSGDTWLDHRATITAGGFVFEYSATFGQALNAADNLELVDEYAKSVVFDYSFRHFHRDGYGKQYDVLNLRDEIADGGREHYLTANLLSYVEQRLCFEDHPDAMDEYNIEDPVWVFVGRTVSASPGSDSFRREASDVVQVLSFLHRFATRPETYTSAVEDVLSGETIFRDERGQSLFSDRFAYLRERFERADELYARAVEAVFNTSSPSGLRLVDLRGVDGELGLRAGDEAAFFGVVNIGNTSRLLNTVAEDAPEIELAEDRFTPSLFDRLDDPDSSTKLLIGAKKFIEGWDNPRVASMGLMNVGRSEGSEIVQIFGRGIRLRGKETDLRRSEARDEPAPEFLSIVETLRIFGIRADYVAKFSDYLGREGIATRHVSFEVPVERSYDVDALGLRIPERDAETEFVDEAVVTIAGDPRGAAPEVELYGRVDVASVDESRRTERVRHEQRIDPSVLPALDWDRLHDDVLEYKRTNGYWNVVVTKDGLRRVLREEHYRLLAPAEFTAFSDEAGYERVMSAARSILRSYVERRYLDERRAWEGSRMRLGTLCDRDPNLDFGGYTLRLPENAPEEVFDDVERLVEHLDEACEGTPVETPEIPRVYIDSHLYQPLFEERSDVVELAPPALRDGEVAFVNDLREYLDSNGHPFENERIYLLRNRTRSGIGFFESSAFAPDFVLWSVHPDGRQRIVFIDTRGPARAFGRPEHPKVRFRSEIKKLEAELDERVQLESFVVSTTGFSDLRAAAPDVSREEWHRNHVFFHEEAYLPLLFEAIEDNA